MNSFRSQQQVKEELLSVLRDAPGNNDRIVALSNELAKLDENYVRFSVDAGIINRLGKELVGKRETAVSELIKNAYDAEASYVNLVFINAQETGGTLQIIDDGLGMTREELINGFMRLSSSDKIHNPISPNYKRKKAGQKGIGRFATQRLGAKLTIITQTATADFAIKVVINWSNFNVDSNLTEVSSQLEIVNKERLKGTTLIIEGLVDQWSDAAISRAYRFTANLLQPEPLSDERILWDKERKDPGFKASFYRNQISPESVIIDDDEAFFNHALATIEGYIDDSGHGYWKTTSTKVNIPTEAYRPIGPNRDDDFSIFVFTDELDLLFYNGYALVSDTEDELRFIQKILKSDVFWYYIKHTSKPYGGDYFALAKNYVKNFGVYNFSNDQKQRILEIEDSKELNDLLCRLYNIDIL